MEPEEKCDCDQMKKKEANTEEEDECAYMKSVINLELLTDPTKFFESLLQLVGNMLSDVMNGKVSSVECAVKLMLEMVIGESDVSKINFDKIAEVILDIAIETGRQTLKNDANMKFKRITQDDLNDESSRMKTIEPIMKSFNKYFTNAVSGLDNNSKEAVFTIIADSLAEIFAEDEKDSVSVLYPYLFDIAFPMVRDRLVQDPGVLEANTNKIIENKQAQDLHERSIKVESLMVHIFLGGLTDSINNVFNGYIKQDKEIEELVVKLNGISAVLFFLSNSTDGEPDAIGEIVQRVIGLQNIKNAMQKIASKAKNMIPTVLCESTPIGKVVCSASKVLSNYNSISDAIEQIENMYKKYTNPKQYFIELIKPILYESQRARYVKSIVGGNQARCTKRVSSSLSNHRKTRRMIGGSAPNNSDISNRLGRSVARHVRGRKLTYIAV